MSTGAYVLVKFEDREKLLPAVASLGDLPEVSKWDAVDGHFDLVLRFKDGSSSALEQIKKLEGFSDLATCELQSDEKEPEYSPDHSYSYLFIDTERYQQKAVQSSLRKIENVASVWQSAGACDLVAVVKGENFDHITRVINNEIRPLDGILRLKQDRIIFLDRM